MKKINKKDIAIFIALLCFSLIIFTGYIKGHFAADTFRIINIGYKNYAIEYSLVDGRIFMAIIGMLAYKVNLPITQYINMLDILAIIVTCIDVIILKNIVLNYKKIDKKWQNIFLIIVCYYTIFNFTYFENMYFVECFVMSLSILFYILAAKEIIKKDKKSYLKGTIYLFLGLISYQGTISAFFIFAILFGMLSEKSAKDMAKDFIKAICLFFIGFLLNNTCIVLTEKIFDVTQTRGLNISQIFKNIGFIINNYLRVLTYTANLFPKYLYIIFIILVSLFVTLKIVKQNSKQYSKKNQIIELEQFIIIVFSIVFAFIPSVINLTGFWSARMRFSIGASIGLLFIHLIVKTNILEVKTKWDKILIGIFILYGTINSINYIHLIYLNKQVNKLDKELVYQIDNYIKEYEGKEDIKVENICVEIKQHEVDKAYYSQMNCTNVGTAVSSVRTEWAAQGIINYYTNRNLRKQVLTKENREEYMMKVDKEKNYLCMDNTLYISVYMY